MRCNPISWFAVAFLLVTNQLFAQAPPTVDRGPKPARQTPSTIDDKTLAVLDRPFDWDIQEVALQAWVEILKKQTGLEYVLDTSALEEAGVGRETPVTFHAHALPIRSALTLILEDSDLTWCVQDGAIKITTYDRIDGKINPRVYDVCDLVADPVTEDDYLPLVRAIETVVDADTWTTAGGVGIIRPWNGSLIVSQTQHVHRRVGDLIRLLRHLTSAKAEIAKVKYLGLCIDPESQAIREKLLLPISFACQDEQLDKVVNRLSQLWGINVILNKKALEEAGVGTDTPASVEAQDLPGMMMLNRLLEPHDLTWVVREGVLMVTTHDRVESIPAICVYPFDGIGESPRNTAPQSAVDGLANLTGGRYENLVEAITATVAPDTWADAGGTGYAKYLTHPAALVVAQTESVHQQIADLFARLRKRELSRAPLTGSSDGSPKNASPATPAMPNPERSADSQLQFVLFPIRLNEDGAPVYQADELARLIRKMIDSDSWSTDSHVFVEPLSRGLAIRHRPAVLRRIASLLQYIDASPAPAKGVKGAPASPGESGGFFSVEVSDQK